MKKIEYIAEIGLNHNGDIKLAKRMIDSAYQCGANAVKFQSLRADKLISAAALKQKIDGFGFKDVSSLGDFWEKVS